MDAEKEIQKELRVAIQTGNEVQKGLCNEIKNLSNTTMTMASILQKIHEEQVRMRGNQQ